MASKNITKPEFSEGLALGPILFWIAAIVAIPFLLIWGVLQGLFTATENISSLSDDPVEEDLDRFGRKPSELFYGWYANDATVFSDMQQEEEKNSNN